MRMAAILAILDMLSYTVVSDLPHNFVLSALLADLESISAYLRCIRVNLSSDLALSTFSFTRIDLITSMAFAFPW